MKLNAAASRSSCIDAFRGFAILGVMIHHFFFRLITENYTFSGTAVFGVFSPLAFCNGWLGVNLFFILSGMVFYRPSLVDSRGKVLDFYVQRCLRLWPMYLVSICILALLDGYSLPKFLGTVFILLCGLHDLSPWHWDWSLTVFWSLGVEILFSISLPVILLAQRRLGFWQVIIFVFAFCFLYRIVADQLWFHVRPTYGNPTINPLKDNILGRLDDFMAGMAIARLTRDGVKLPRSYLIAAILLLVGVGNIWSYLWFAPHGILASFLASAAYTVFSLSIGVVLLVVSNLKVWETAYAKPLVFAGTVCYSAYIVHALLQHAFALFSRPAFIEFSILPRFAFFVAVTMAISTITFTFIESVGIRHLPDWSKSLAVLLRRRSIPAAK
jgi:peptidoglycan/LPS O-acetylase OafA/YrhL